MIKYALPLSLLLLLAGCDSSGLSNQADTVPAEPVANKSDVEEQEASAPAALKPGTRSVMRPSVVAEAEQEKPPPQPEPVTGTIGFPSGGAELDEAARAKLEALLASPAAAGPSRVTLRGHSDTRGTDRQNMRASEKRAEAVRDYLIERGLAPERITVIALGETRPIAPNANPDGSDYEEGRRKNRRVEVEIVPAATAEPEAPGPAGKT